MVLSLRERERKRRENEAEMKYVLVTGGVVSGLGKGVTASSIGVVLKACGLRVTSIKIGTLHLLLSLSCRSVVIQSKIGFCRSCFHYG